MEKYINKIMCADAYEEIKKLDDNSIDCIYTDIPYEYGKAGGGIAL